MWAQRLARDSAEETSALRSLFFLGVLGVTLIETAEGAGEVLFVPLARLAGNSFETAILLDHLAEVVVYGLFWTYHIRQRPPAQLQSGAAATITRWYWYAASFGSLGIVVTSFIPLLTTILQRFFGVETANSTWWELPIANSVAWIIVGSVGWTYHWAMIQRRTASADSPELRSALRKVYLYLSVGIAAAGALLAVGRILYLILLNVLNAVDDRLAFLDNLAWVIPVALVAATGWFLSSLPSAARRCACFRAAPASGHPPRILLHPDGNWYLSVGVWGLRYPAPDNRHSHRAGGQPRSARELLAATA